MSSSAAELLAHEAFVARLARSLAADEAAAEDLVQETWLAALRARIEEPGLRSWLARVLGNLAASDLRGRARRIERERDCARPERQPDTARLVERVELHHRLVAHVLGLPEAYREVVLRHYFRGESVGAMARGLGRPEATVRTRLRRARELLRAELGDPFTGRGGAFLAALGMLDTTTRWTTDWLMKKSLLQTPVLVGGLLGAGLGFGGSLLVRDDPAASARPVSADERALVAPAAAVDSAREERELEIAAAEHVARREPAAEPEPAAPGVIDLQRMLLSSRRIDQARAIQFLLDQGTAEAHGLLLDAFLETTDPILMALLEEALMKSGADVAPAVLAAYRTSLDPARLERLASTMTELVRRDRALEPAVVELVLGALREPGPGGERLAGLPGLLAEIGAGALDALAGYLADPLSDSAGDHVAAAALRGMAADQAERVREGLEAIFGALVAASGDPELTAEQRDAVRQRTSMVAWAAFGRPHEEHDRMGDVLSEQLFHATDSQQAQTLAWGLASLEGLSEGTRTRLARSMLEALPRQPDQELRQSYLWGVSQLVTRYGNRQLDQEFFDVLALVEGALHAGHDNELTGQLLWLQNELEKHREKLGG